MTQDQIDKAWEGVTCTCHRTPDEIKSKDHIMGCAVRSRAAAIIHFQMEQAELRIERALEKMQ